MLIVSKVQLFLFYLKSQRHLAGQKYFSRNEKLSISFYTEKNNRNKSRGKTAITKRDKTEKQVSPSKFGNIFCFFLLNRSQSDNKSMSASSNNF